MKKIFQKAVGDNPGLIEQYAKGLEQAKVEHIHVPCELCMLVKCTTCGSEEPKGYLKLF